MLRLANPFPTLSAFQNFGSGRRLLSSSSSFITHPVTNLDQQRVGEVNLSPSVFDAPVRLDIIHRVVRWYRANARSGTAKVKGIDEISGSGKKPHKQKGKFWTLT